MPATKPYSQITIRECGEPLAAIPRDMFTFFEPHPYVALNAPYGDTSPWMLRRSILDSLRKAQEQLQRIRLGWKIMLFDAYRPNSVQIFMVERELTMLARSEGLDPADLSPTDRDRLMAKVYSLFAIPNTDPAAPPPHSTGAAFDCTLADENGHEVDMGSPIDENSSRSLPDYFATAADETEKQAHANRLLLRDILAAEGFTRHPTEWWHFSRGDQLAAWVQRTTNPSATAIYGRADLLSA